MVAELSALQQIVSALTGLDGLPAVIVQCVVTTIYTSLGGFKVSFITDNIQGAMVVGLIIIGVITVGVETEIDKSLVDSSGLLESSLLGWQLLYILPVAIFTNDFFISGFWLRTFASRTDKDLRIGTGIATVAVAIILAFVGSAGLLAAWSGAWPGDPPQDGAISFFLLLGQLPAWVVGIVLVMVVSLSTAAFDSFQSAMVSNGSNDIFRNRLNIWFIRLSVVLIIVPVVVVALKSPDILTIYLISDLVSASLVPVLVIGLSDRCYWWRGFEVVVGALGGFLLCFYLGPCIMGMRGGGEVDFAGGGLYAEDWGAFGMLPSPFASVIEAREFDVAHMGAFVAAPVGALLWALAALILRIAFLFLKAKVQGRRFDAFDRPTPADPGRFAGTDALGTRTGDEERDSVVRGSRRAEPGKFF
ncbi:hypothetical protein H2199_005522 [Coniosporium tulheliwenetii]|uniref:Uncharacterized protein n=1 Tax=Coniosporium tulheliwenetii TaxID=3383036 RepID=A0ACC2Z2R9_9PEZI|nr:hypothetical protein H2199_005522 [Cladosporium sp. JES 115]